MDIVTEGQYYCGSPDKGVAHYYSNGQLVETGALFLSDSVGECLRLEIVVDNGNLKYGADSMAQHATYISQFKGPIDSIIIARPTPDTVVIGWEPFYNPLNGLYIISDISANYMFQLLESPGPGYCPPTSDPVINDPQMIAAFKAPFSSRMLEEITRRQEQSTFTQARKRSVFSRFRQLVAGTARPV